jgi:hypothetical protein
MMQATDVGITEIMKKEGKSCRHLFHAFLWEANLHIQSVPLSENEMSFFQARDTAKVSPK